MEEGGQVQKKEDALPRMALQIGFQPRRLFCCRGQAAVEYLGIEDDKVQPGRVPTLPGGAAALVKVVQIGGCYPIRGHCGVWLVADVVVARHKAGRDTARGQLGQGFLHGLGKTGALRELLHQIAHVDHRQITQPGDRAQGKIGAGGLPASRVKLDRLAGGVQHIMGVGDEDKFVKSWREVGEVEHWELSNESYCRAILTEPMRRNVA